MTITETIASGDVAALNYFIAEKYLKAFGQLAESPNQKVLMLPIETAGVLATLGGIAKIAKHSFRDGAVGPPSPRHP
jgi:regulator of protease activity HflC (stomatin/prohibitin superfamily)